MTSQKKGGWGSLLSGAVANLESRLDTILADDGEASARERAVAEAAKQAKTALPRANSGNLSIPSRNASTKGSRESSRTRTNDRLAERLAKATAQKVPSRVATPVNDPEAARASTDVKRSTEIPRVEVEVNEPNSTGDGEDAKITDTDVDRGTKPEELSTQDPELVAIATRLSLESSRPSTELAIEDTSTRTSIEITNGQPIKSNAELLAELEQMRADNVKAETQRNDEIHVYMERIDALQAKLTYLAKETVAAAKEANASSDTTDVEKQMAEKDERIALLMEEGQKLSMNEMKHLQTIKKLRTNGAVDERTGKELKKRLERAERAEGDLMAKLKRVETSERQANEKVRQIAVIEKQVDELRVDRESAAELVRSLTTQLKEAKEKAVHAEKQAEIRAAEADKDKIAALQNDLEDAQIEKKLAEDRAATDLRKAKEEAIRQKERFGVQELEFKNEIFALEARLETMRSRAEEASATGGGVEGESSVKLLRQVETLQQQYALAKGNWETIEGSLNSRVAALEVERDEANRRENEIRKKARDLGLKARKAEDQHELSLDQIKSLERDLNAQQEQVTALQTKLDRSETAHTAMKSEFEQQKKLWESELSQRIEEERQKWRREMAISPSRPDFGMRKVSGLEGVNSFTRRPMTRVMSNDHAGVHGDQQRPNSRRSSNMHRHGAPEPIASLVRRESDMSFDTPTIPPTPAIEIDDNFNEDFETPSSPQRTINDIVSTSAAGSGAGPSVQLVERMSALVRKLESEKASFKDELGRLSTQRDDARNEVVTLMREVETKRDQRRKVKDLETELKTLQERYNASLEMLGEREEEVDELKLDVAELKKIYRELVETKVGGGQA